MTTTTPHGQHTPGVIDNKAFYEHAKLYGRPSEGRIGGCVRGGYAYDGKFVANGPIHTFHVQEIKNTTGFKIHGE